MYVKFQKDRPKTVRGVALTRKHENVTDRLMDRRTDSGKNNTSPEPFGGRHKCVNSDASESLRASKRTN